MDDEPVAAVAAVQANLGVVVVDLDTAVGGWHLDFYGWWRWRRRRRRRRRRCGFAAITVDGRTAESQHHHA